MSSMKIDLQPPTKIQQSSMDFNGNEAAISQEERESLMMNSYGGGGGFPAVKVVEYMLSSMSNELLCKFPDNSAFDFDYTQSSIWSPFPHPSNPSSPAPDLQRKLSYDDGELAGDGMVWKSSSSGGGATCPTAVKTLTANIKGKIVNSCVFSCFRIHPKIGKKKTTMMMMKKRTSSFRGFEQLGSIYNGMEFKSIPNPTNQTHEGIPNPSKSKSLREIQSIPIHSYKPNAP